MWGEDGMGVMGCKQRWYKVVMVCGGNGAMMLWYGDNVRAERMQGGGDVDVGGQQCGEMMVWDGDGAGW